MPKAFAINTVHICKTPGKRNSEGKIIEPAIILEKLPGSVFRCSDKDFAVFEAAGAVRLATKLDEAAAAAGGEDDADAPDLLAQTPVPQPAA